MLVWTALPILILSALACGPFHDSIPTALEPLAQLTTVLSLFVLVCAMEAGGAAKTVAGRGRNQANDPSSFALGRHSGARTSALPSRCFSHPNLRIIQAHKPIAGSRPIHSRTRTERW